MKNIHLQEDCLKRLSPHSTLHTEMCFTRSATKAHKGYMSVRLYFELAAEPGIIHTVLIGKQASEIVTKLWTPVSRSQEATESEYL